MSEAKQFVTPTGRMVWGSTTEPQTKDADGKPLVIKSGPNAGQPTQRFAFGVAIAKGAEKHWAETIWGAIIWGVGHAAYPAQAQRPDFAWKVIDGDSQVPNKRGHKPCDKEGYKGHWILSFSSSYAPRTYNSDGTGAVPAESIKCGYFIQVAGNVVGNDSGQNPGVFVNHNMVALQGYGPEIVSGPDPTSVGFGGGPAPAGMSAAPVGALATPPAPGAPVPVAAAPVAPAAPPPPGAAAAAPPPPQTAVAPAPAFLAPGAAPPPPPAVVTAPVRQMTAKANGATFEQFTAQGWKEADLRQHGYLI